jgi:hypothetical protein
LIDFVRCLLSILTLLADAASKTALKALHDGETKVGGGGPGGAVVERSRRVKDDRKRAKPVSLLQARRSKYRGPLFNVGSDEVGKFLRRTTKWIGTLPLERRANVLGA